jgi:hypothetical protein
MRFGEFDTLSNRAKTGDSVSKVELTMLLQKDLRAFIALYAVDSGMIDAIIAVCWPPARQWLADLGHPHARAPGGLWMGQAEAGSGGAVAQRLHEQALDQLRQRLAATCQQAVAAGDAVGQLIAQAGIAALPAAAGDAPEVLRLIRDKIRMVPPAANGLLAKRYAEGLSLAQIAVGQERSEAEVAAALGMARTAVDWQAGGMMMLDPCDQEFPVLIEAYLAGAQSAAMRAKLAQRMLGDQGRSAAFVRQIRLDLVLDAFSRTRPIAEAEVLASAPSPTRSSNRLPAASSSSLAAATREVPRRLSSTGRTTKPAPPSRPGSSPRRWYLIGGGVALLGLLAGVVLVITSTRAGHPSRAHAAEAPTARSGEQARPAAPAAMEQHPPAPAAGAPEAARPDGVARPAAAGVLRPVVGGTAAAGAGGPATFVRGIAFGETAVAIAGHNFLAIQDALLAGLRLAPGTTCAPGGVISSPGLDFDRKAMLGSGLSAAGGAVGLTQQLPNAAYEVQLWLANDHDLGDELPQVTLQGEPALAPAPAGHASSWIALGPYRTAVANRSLSLSIAGLGGARVCGISFTAIGKPEGGAPPLVSVATPAAGAEVIGDVVIVARVQGGSDIAEVQVLDGERQLFKAVREPYRWSWSDAPKGPVTISVQVTDSAGFITRSAPVSFTIAAYSDAFTSVAETTGYALAYAIDLDHLAHDITYDTDHSRELDKPFDRIGYFLQLSREGGSSSWVWASMDAFTTEIRKIAIPSAASGAFFQQEVANLVVASNDKEVTAGTFATGGNIEFWPNNYGPANSAHVANASDQLFDFGDQPTSPKDGYGCMQVHNHGAQQTIFAINHWVAGRAADIGIGNSSGPQSRDWTFSGNAHSWSKKQLRIYVRPKP